VALRSDEPPERLTVRANGPRPRSVRGTSPARGGGLTYLLSRRTRLAGGTGSAGFEWAAGIGTKVKEITGHDVQLWANVYSAGFGTISWTAWFENLTALETMGDQLAADSSYNEMVNAGAALTEGGVDDGVVEPIYGAPDPDRPIQYVAGATALIAAGSFERTIGVGIQLVDLGQKITGIPSIFVRALTGPYGSVGWLTGYESLAEMEKATAAQAADPAMLKLIDSTQGCFVEDAGATQTTLYRRLA